MTLMSAINIAIPDPPEHNQLSTVAGYPRLADQIGHQPQLGIYRKFPALNARDLLYMQAEIIDLEKELREAENEDSQISEQRRFKYSSDWWYLQHAAKVEGLDENHDAYKQRNIVARLRILLGQYSELR
jgi:hypothetical protein